MHYNNTFLSNEKDIAKAMNDFFVNVGPNLNRDIKDSICSYFNFRGPYTHNSIFITDVTSYGIHLLLNKIQLNKSCGHFSFPNKILKDNCNIFSSILPILISKSLDEVHFPTILKEARVCPIYKRVIKRKVVTTDQSYYYLI